MGSNRLRKNLGGKFLIGWKMTFLNCNFIFKFQLDGCVEYTWAVTCFIHFGQSHRPDNIRLMLTFSTKIYARGVFICFFIYSFCWWVGLECTRKSENISVYNTMFKYRTDSTGEIRINTFSKIIVLNLVPIVEVKKKFFIFWRTKIKSWKCFKPKYFKCNP